MLRVDIEKVHFNMFNSDKPFEEEPKYNGVEVIATFVNAVTTSKPVKEIPVLHKKKKHQVEVANQTALYDKMHKATSENARYHRKYPVQPPHIQHRMSPQEEAAIPHRDNWATNK